MNFHINMRKPIALSGVKKLHNQGYLGQNITVGVIDNGFDNHPEVEDRILRQHGRNFAGTRISDPNNTYDESRSGHGTAVASLIIGKNLGAPQAKMIPLKVKDGLNESSKWSIVNAFEYVRDNADLFDIVSMSMGWTQKGILPDVKAKLEKVIHEVVVDKGIPVIVAAGNTGDEQYFWPAGFQDVVSVGAVDIEKKAAWFTTMNNEVDLCQIGVDVHVADLDGGYAMVSGTSFACPIVTQIAVTLLSKYKAKFGKRMAEPDLYAALLNNTIDVDIEGIDKKTGAGFCTLGSGVHTWMMPGQKEYKINGETYTARVPVTTIDYCTMVHVRMANTQYGVEFFSNEDNSIEMFG
jgi:major intracellular serine protease